MGLISMGWLNYEKRQAGWGYCGVLSVTVHQPTTITSISVYFVCCSRNWYMSTVSRHFHFHLVSDSTGETLNTIAKAAAAQFEDAAPHEHLYALVRSEQQLL